MTTKIPQLEIDLLAGLLGQLDALFFPVNLLHRPAADAARWQRRDKYLGRWDWPAPGLLAWQNPGEDAAEKKRISRGINELERRGYVRMSGLKEIGLTDDGLAAARSLCGRWQLADVVPGLDHFMALTGTDHEWKDEAENRVIESGYFSECSLSGMADPLPDGPPGILRLPESRFWVIDGLTPLAIAGLIDHSFQPRFEGPLYCLTERGRELADERAAAGKADCAAWLRLGNGWDQYRGPDAYFSGWIRADNFLNTARPLQPNRIKHRLSGCTWPDAALTEDSR